MLRIITAAIAGSVMIFVIYTWLSKKGWSAKMPGIGTGWKITFVFLWVNLLRPKKLIMWTIIFGAGYGIYLLVNYCTPSKSERLANSALQEQMKRKLAEGPEKRLAEINDEAKKRPLTPAEENEIVEENKEAESILKEYSTKLKPPSLAKPSSVKPKVITKSAWVARLSADREQIKDAVLIELNQAANDKIEVDTKSPFLITDTEIMFSYKKRGKLHEALLTRENPQLEHYYGIVDLSDNTQLELWLKEDGLEKYKGNARQIIKKGRKIIYGPLITASLRKEEVVVSLGQ